MSGSMMKFRKASMPGRNGRLKMALALGAVGLALSGCVVYPAGYGYGYGGYDGGYYGGPAYYAPPVALNFGYGGGWGGGRGRWR